MKFLQLKNVSTVSATFKCSDGKLISMTSYCDFKDDCEDRSDEINCGKQLIHHHLLANEMDLFSENEKELQMIHKSLFNLT